MLAGLAGVVALVALFVPIPTPKPSPTASSAPPGPAAPAIPKPEDVAVKPEDWKALAATLESLREKPPEKPEVADSGEKEPEIPETPTQPIIQPLAWKYRGFIQEPDRLVALVMLDSVQRFLVQGQDVPDPEEPGTMIRVVSVSTQELVVSRGGRDEKIPLESAQVSAEPATRSRPDSRFGPRGARP